MAKNATTKAPFNVEQVTAIFASDTKQTKQPAASVQKLGWGVANFNLALQLLDMSIFQVVNG